MKSDLHFELFISCFSTDSNIENSEHSEAFISFTMSVDGNRQFIATLPSLSLAGFAVGYIAHYRPHNFAEVVQHFLHIANFQNVQK